MRDSLSSHSLACSILTMVMMLSEPGVDFQGGVLRASATNWESGVSEAYVDVPLQHKGDCVVFPR
jgi:hypothetical protein